MWGTESGVVVEESVYQRKQQGQPGAEGRGQPQAAPVPCAGEAGCLVNTTISRENGLSLKSVHMCESGSHHFAMWDPKNPSNIIFLPFRCRSWRHAGGCQRFKGAQDFVRVSEGILSRGDRWVYLVLTFDQRRESSEWDCYRLGLTRWSKFLDRLEYHHGKIAYVQTWEKHRNGFPHVNVVIHNEQIWNLCQHDGWRSWRQSLIPHLTETGFGKVVHVEPLRPDTGKGLAGYLTKLSRELTGAGIKNQVPVNAPPHFRRIRASQGLLPPIHRPGKMQGVMIPTRSISAVDLTPEGIRRLVAARLAHSGAKKGGCGDGADETQI